MLILFTILLLIAQSISTVFAIAGKDSTHKFTRWDYGQIILSILALSSGILIFLLNEDKDDLKARLETEYKESLKVQLSQRDSVHQKQDSIQSTYFVTRLDSSYEKSIRSSNEALAKYNLILIDSLNTVVKKVNVQTNKKPQLSIKAAEIGEVGPIYFVNEGNSSLLKIKLTSINNTSYNIKLRYVILKLDLIQGTNRMTYSTVDTGAVFYSHTFITENVVSTAVIELKPSVQKIGVGVVLILGKFSYEQENKTVQPFEEGFYIDFNKKVFNNYFSVEFLTQIKNTLIKKGIL